MRTQSILTVCFLVLSCCTVYSAEKSDVASAVKLAASKPHPRLIFTKELEKKLREQLAEDKDMRKFFESIRADADSLLKKPPQERIMEGHRLPLHVGLPRRHPDFAHQDVRQDLLLAVAGRNHHLAWFETRLERGKPQHPSAVLTGLGHLCLSSEADGHFSPWRTPPPDRDLHTPLQDRMVMKRRPI